MRTTRSFIAINLLSAATILVSYLVLQDLLAQPVSLMFKLLGYCIVLGVTSVTIDFAINDWIIDEFGSQRPRMIQFIDYLTREEDRAGYWPWYRHLLGILPPIAGLLLCGWATFTLWYSPCLALTKAYLFLALSIFLICIVISIGIKIDQWRYEARALRSIELSVQRGIPKIEERRKQRQAKLEEAPPPDANESGT